MWSHSCHSVKPPKVLTVRSDWFISAYLTMCVYCDYDVSLSFCLRLSLRIRRWTWSRSSSGSVDSLAMMIYRINSFLLRHWTSPLSTLAPSVSVRTPMMPCPHFPPVLCRFPHFSQRVVLWVWPAETCPSPSPAPPRCPIPHAVNIGHQMEEFCTKVQ